ncbi:MAG: type II toxin-antitoxin system RelE/ParE family toxin [Rhodomicrobium sp.]
MCPHALHYSALRYRKQSGKLITLAEARVLADLRSPPANRLEPLKADREGQYSIRINSQFRLCFIWTGSDAEEVEIVDYH